MRMASSSSTLAANLRTSITRLPSIHRSPSCIPARSQLFIRKPLACSLIRPRRVSGIGANPKKFDCRAKFSMAEKRQGKVDVFDSEESLSVSLAKYTADLSEKFAKERGAFTVVLSGGSLINSLRKLVEAPYIDSVDWSKWHIFWVDERVVPKDHEDSNYKLAYDGFLCKVWFKTFGF
ncbi:hypothetical protein CsSME_00029437 [Camellia sinensis var. sinensis]